MKYCFISQKAGGLEEMSQCIKCWPLKNEALSSDPQNQGKQLGMVACACNVCTGEQRQEDPRGLMPAKASSSVRYLVSRTQGVEMIEERHLDINL